MASSVQALLLEASSKYCLPDGFKPSYGTAGFRAQAHLLHSTIFRCGLLMAIRALKSQQNTGICITASHNPAPDNGVKLVEPSGEMLQQIYEPIADELANAQSDEALAQLVAALMEKEGVTAGASPGAVLIAHDTRPSGPELAAAAAAGVQCLGLEARMLGLLTTPQLHWTVMRTNRGEPAAEGDYYTTLASAFARLVGTKTTGVQQLQVDCANGVGAPKMAALAPLLVPAGLELTPRNTGGGVLNGGCGSDFLQGSRRMPEGFDDVAPGTRCCAVDGDADRLMYFVPLPESAGGGVVLLDGDKIAVLAATLIQELVAALPQDLSSEVTVGIVQTAYANGASTAYIQGTVGCQVALTPTGVKHLHAAAHSFDIGIYFEANGHGTVLFRPALLERLRGAVAAGSAAAAELLALDGVINAAVGDAISGILLVEAALRRKGWSLEQWAAMYQDLPSKQQKVKVADRSVIKTVNAETQVAEPKGLQEAIDAVVAQVPAGRSFVRPSGTEDVVRVYAEASTQEGVEQLTAEVARLVYKFAGGVGPEP